MAALAVSQVVLYLAAAVIGFAVGWRMRVLRQAAITSALEQDIEELRTRVHDAHARRARGA